MHLKTTHTRRRIIADLAAFAEGQVFLVVEVKAMHGAASIAADWLIKLLVHMRDFNGDNHPFAMVVDLDEILVFDTRKADPTLPVCRFKTEKILGVLDPEFASKQIFDDNLLGLIETWLQAFGWRLTLADPPGMKEFTSVGLAGLLPASSVYRSVHLADADPVH